MKTFTQEKVKRMAKAIRSIAETGKCFRGKTLGELDIYTAYRHGVRYQYREDCFGFYRSATISDGKQTLVDVTWQPNKPRGQKLGVRVARQVQA